MPARVVDTSVVAAFVFKEERAREAELLLQAEELYAPPLLAYELANVAYNKVMRAKENADDIAEALLIGLSIGIKWVEPDHNGTFWLALESGLTAYDASYLYIARMLGAELVTFDRKLDAAARPRSR